MSSQNSSALGMEFRRGWTIVMVACVGMGCGLSAIPIYSIGTFTKPLIEAFGWSRAEVQGIYSWMTIGNLVAAPALGWLIDMQGVRRIALWSVVGMGVGYVALGLIAGPLWSFYMLAFFTAVIGVGTVPITWTRVVIDWFDVGRGRALGLALTGSGITAMIIPTYTNWLITEYGWRMAFIGLGLLPTAVAFPMVYFFLHDRTGIRHDKNALPSAPKVVEQTGLDFRAAISGYRFWAINVAFFLVGACVAGLIAHLVPMLTDQGIERGTAAQIAGVIGASVIVARIGSGYLIDRFWAPGVGMVLLCMPAIACLILMSNAGSVPLALLSAMLIGIAAGAEFDIMAFLVSQYFGQRRYGVIYACAYTVFKISAGVGAPLFGFAFDRTGSYGTILMLAIGSLVAGSALLLVLGRYPAKAEATAAA
ncbi:MAG: MFS transporter [Rhodospirillaceae bacterium]|nr:MFS transporter [Rhodospirillaceae bacterium]